MVVQVPPTSRWDYIVKNATSKEIGYIIKYAMIGIERENKPLNKLRKELQLTFLDRLVNGQKNLSSIIYLINDEKTHNDIFWFKISMWVT